MADQIKQSHIPTDNEVSKIIATHHTTKNAALYYATKANRAAGRAKLALSEQNSLLLAAEVQTMIENVDALVKFLSDDSIAIADK